MGAGEVGADLDAGDVACLGRAHQADAGPDQQRLDGRDAHTVRVGEVGVGRSLELAHEQHRALLGGQAAHVGDQPAKVLAALGLGQRIGLRRAHELEPLQRDGDRAAQLVDAAVVGDAVQPRAQRDRPPVRAQGRVRAQEDVLERVLGIVPRARQHLAHVGEEALVVTVVDDPEGLLVARAEEGHELVVGPQTQERRRKRDSGQPCRGLQSRGFHALPRLIVTGQTLGSSAGGRLIGPSNRSLTEAVLPAVREPDQEAQR
jgi:hypothetical protein